MPTTTRTPSPPIQQLAALATFDIGQRTLGPRCELAAEADRLAGLRWRHFRADRLAPTIGAELQGVQLAELDDEAMAELRRAILDYKVVVLPDQHLDADAQVAFSRRLGELEVHPFLLGDDQRPEIVRLVKDAAVGGYENIWHSDVSWRERPARFGILRGVEVPDVGGDTLFADMAAAYEGLPEALRTRIDGLTAVHDMAQSFGQGLTEAARAEARATYPAVEHPVVRTHDETGRRLLYVNAIFTSHIVGLDRAESDALLDRLYRQTETPEYQCRVRWRNGTVVIWDNQATQHYAASDYWPQRRVAERTAVRGDRPR